jgi:hypothetical protein
MFIQAHPGSSRFFWLDHPGSSRLIQVIQVIPGSFRLFRLIRAHPCSSMLIQIHAHPGSSGLIQSYQCSSRLIQAHPGSSKAHPRLIQGSSKAHPRLIQARAHPGSSRLIRAHPRLIQGSSKAHPSCSFMLIHAHHPLHLELKSQTCPCYNCLYTFKLKDTLTTT